MIKIKSFILVAVISLFAMPILGNAATGDIQVSCESGVRIFIDNHFKGVTNDSDSGLFVEGLAPGRHTLKAIKKGFDPYEKNISITANKAIEIKISFGERPEIVKGLQSEEGQTHSQVGKMELRSVPLGAKVTIDGKSYQQKTDMEIENIPIGKHQITFDRNNQKLSGIFNLSDNEILKLKAHFKEKRIIDLSKLEREERKAKENEREKNRLEREAREKREIDRDGSFIAYANGTVLDTRTNLMWAAKPIGERDWRAAQRLGNNYRGGGYTDWRMPTMDELAELSKNSPQGHLTRLINCSEYLKIWSSQSSESEKYVDPGVSYYASGFNFKYGKMYNFISPGEGIGILPVRSAK